MRRASSRAGLVSDPELIVRAIEAFLARAQAALLVAAGEPAYRVLPEQCEIARRGSVLWWEIWDGDRCWRRRLAGYTVEPGGVVRLLVHRLGGQVEHVILIDAADPRHHYWLGRSRRHNFANTFKRFLCRQFPGWNLERFSAEADLARSLSPLFPRALLRRGSSFWAAVAAPPLGPQSVDVLAYALIWLDHLRRELNVSKVDLILFLPRGCEHGTSLRLRWLNLGSSRLRLFVYDQEGAEREIDPNDWGNLQTKLEPWLEIHHVQFADDPACAALIRLPFVECVPLPGRCLSFRIRGLEVARWDDGHLEWQLQVLREAASVGWPAIVQRLCELERLRSPDSHDLRHPYYLQQPERWLESEVRKQLTAIDPRLCPEPVYGQVPQIAGLDRAVLDLLAIEHSGRLVVLELKATEDVQLPLQALDYWARVRHHLLNGDFERFGYFRGRTIRRVSPRLIFVAPCLQFHPTTELLLGYFSEEVPVERVGVNMNWREGLQVVFRATGAKPPAASSFQAPV